MRPKSYQQTIVPAKQLKRCIGRLVGATYTGVDSNP